MIKRPYHHGNLRSAMLAAAETILDRDGPDALTLRAAAREAGVTHAAPVHHFGDLSGLLSLLAASGFDRFRDHLLAEAGAVGIDRRARLTALCTAYVGFAQAHPGLFQLMFRSGRLDWSRPELVEAAGTAFALLTREPDGGNSEGPLGMDHLAMVFSLWSMAHGLAMLSLDGRLGAFAEKEGVDVDALVAAIARRLPIQA